MEFTFGFITGGLIIGLPCLWLWYDASRLHSHAKVLHTETKEHLAKALESLEAADQKYKEGERLLATVDERLKYWVAAVGEG